MKSKKHAKARGSGLPTTSQTAAMPPTSALASGTRSMFHNAQNTNITEPSLDALHKRVAPNAILNAGGRADEVRCHPGTREEVISRIEKWGDMQDDQTIFWLSGPAGAGKSAIVQTIAERCKQRKVPHANFFFFRADTSRSNASSLVATLLHQILLLYPSQKEPVATLLSDNPLIFKSTLEDQLVQLIVTPLRTIQMSSIDYHPLVLLLDGLDECDSESNHNQQKLLHVFDKVMVEHPCPVRVLVASRGETLIQVAFNRMSSPCLQLYLDDKYFPESDIRVLVNDQFEQVRQTHPLAHTLSATWPSVHDVNFIVEKSSGQFIYAATVMRFISDSAASPKLSLERVQGAARRATKSPFAQLDAIYSYILSRADDQELLKNILRAKLTITALAEARRPDESPKITLMMLLELYNSEYTEDVVLSCLAELTPIARYADNELQFHHASFPDYLLDQLRPGEYFVVFATFSYTFLPVLWELLKNESFYRKTWLEFGLCGIHVLKKLPPRLIKTLASSNIAWSECELGESYIFGLIRNLCISDDDVIVFKKIVREWIYSRDFVEIRYDDVRHIPFGCWYFHMACADHYWEVIPDSEMLDALRPETDLDSHELALWLNDLLHRIRRQVL
ncbi:hypothetical protein D9619_011293 [Psilocybe cf. subviscida]|uniref:NACHT domain-containing protein n=1 Tax=Psilocybe cf. subviscida TaxID=2480587 RepID=A0A8H5F591_9AGAR|nr:hypothetical protein D9619_011293 [Psilocybe cf. subviscida]